MKRIVFAIPVVLAVAGFLYFRQGHIETTPESAVAMEVGTEPAGPAYDVRSIEIPPEATFVALLEEEGVPVETALAIYDASKDIYDLAQIRAGKTIDLQTPKGSGGVSRLVYAIDTEDELHVESTDEGWTAERLNIPYEVRTRTVEGTVESSLYASALAQGIDERAVIAMADVFQWDIDFAQDVRVGDTYKFIYEERWRDGKYAMPGSVMAAKYVNDGTEKTAFLFRGADGEEGYFDKDGRTLKRPFLKAPVAFKYITSGFTTGRRYVAAFNTSTGHRAIDYAASTGTPVRTVGDGTVVSAGWNGPYGNFISIRHNGTFTTNYAHLSRILVKRGQKVTQSDIIGKVGSTGFSTGPHLHYEMVKNGVKINPLKEKFEAGEPIGEADKPAFSETVAKWEGQL